MQVMLDGDFHDECHRFRLRVIFVVTKGSSPTQCSQFCILNCFHSWHSLRCDGTRGKSIKKQFAAASRPRLTPSFHGSLTLHNEKRDFNLKEGETVLEFNYKLLGSFRSLVSFFFCFCFLLYIKWNEFLSDVSRMWSKLTFYIDMLHSSYFIKLVFIELCKLIIFAFSTTKEFAHKKVSLMFF